MIRRRAARKRAVLTTQSVPHTHTYKYGSRRAALTSAEHRPLRKFLMCCSGVMR